MVHPETEVVMCLLPRSGDELFRHRWPADAGSAQPSADLSTADGQHLGPVWMAIIVMVPCMIPVSYPVIFEGPETWDHSFDKYLGGRLYSLPSFL